MTSRLRTVTVDTLDPYRVAQFWAQVLKGRLADDDEPGDPAASVTTDAGWILLFEANTDSKAGKNRLHLDLVPDGPRDEEVDWLLTIGATLKDDLRNPDGTGWAVMQDPEGNEFCVLRSDAERIATS